MAEIEYNEIVAGNVNTSVSTLHTSSRQSINTEMFSYTNTYTSRTMQTYTHFIPLQENVQPSQLSREHSLG